MITAIVILGIVLQAAFIVMERQKKLRLAVLLKGLAAFCFVLVGFLCSDGEQFSKTVVWGLVYGMLGDIFLGLRYVFTHIRNKLYIMGCVIFLCGHVFYIVALLPGVRMPLVPILIGLCLAVVLERWLYTHTAMQDSIRALGIVYLSAVSVMAVSAVWARFAAVDGRSGLGSLLFAIGGVLFLISDFGMLYNSYAEKKSFRLRVQNLSLYYMGQMLIALSLIWR